MSAAFGVYRVPFTVIGKQYFVSSTLGNDANNGLSRSSPKQTLQNSVKILLPGDTLNVMAGNYVGFITAFDPSGTYGPISGTAQNPITIQIDPQAVPRSAIVTSRNNKTPIGIDLEPGCSYVNINGLKVTNDTSISKYGIKVSGATGNVISNCVVLGVGATGIYTSFLEAGQVLNNISNNNLEHGIYMANGSNNKIVRGNQCAGNSSAGIQFNADATQGGSGVSLNNLIELNTLFNNGVKGAAGINLDGCQNSVIRNNLIYGEHSSGIVLYHLDAAQGSINNVVLNNTVVLATDGRWCLNINTNSTGNTIFNNVLFNQGANGTITIDAASLVGTVMDYNVVMNLFQNAGTNQTLAQWRTATSQDLHSFTSTLAALFNSPGTNDYHPLSTSPTRDTGIATLNGFNAPNIDLDGNPRPIGAGYDIGCYELQT